MRINPISGIVNNLTSNSSVGGKLAIIALCIFLNAVISKDGK